MPSYCIVELDDGLTIVEQSDAADPEDTALRAGGARKTLTTRCWRWSRNSPMKAIRPTHG